MRSHVGDQLVLGLNTEGGHGSPSRVPWEGRSPRDLTRVALGLILKPRGVKSVSDLFSAQLDLFEVAHEDAPSLWEGAPTLLPLPWEV